LGGRKGIRLVKTEWWDAGTAAAAAAAASTVVSVV